MPKINLIRNTRVSVRLYCSIAVLLFSCLTGVASRLLAQTITLIPQRAYAYINGVGVNSHLRYTHLPYYTQFETIIYPKLKSLGIKNLRDNFPHPGFLGSVNASLIQSRHLKLYDSCGIRFDYLLDSRRVIDTARFLNDAAYLELFETNPQLIKTIQHFEGFNEPDRTIAVWFPGSWTTLTHTIQKSLWTKTHSMPALNGVTIINASPVMYGYHPSLPDSLAAVTPHISNYCDYANFHPYDVNGGANNIYPGARYDRDSTYYDTIRQNKPWIVTEMGFPNARGFNNPAACAFAINSFHYTSELSAGKYYSTAFMEFFRKGAERVYAYELIDQNTADQGDVEKNFGLLRTDGSEKPAFTAIKNTLSILKDTGLIFPTEPLTISLSGNTTGVHYNLYQKSNGKYILAMWLGGERGASYDYTTFTDIAVPSQAVQITLTSTADSIKVYQPLYSGLPVNSYLAQDIINVNVPDHLLLVELSLPLPSAVDILPDFNAERMDVKNVRLNWDTKGLEKEGRFILTQSADGIKYEPVNARQTTHLHSSQYQQTLLQSSGAYYRLQYIDKQGTLKYSSTKWIDGDGFYVQPNPFTSYFSIYLPVKQKVAVYDSGGKLLYQRDLPAGTHRIDMSEHPKGMYFLTYGNGKSKKLVKL